MTQLSFRINAWLNSIQFRKIDQQLRTQLKPTQEIRFMIETNGNLLRRLPWQEWDFFADYPYTEVALSADNYQHPHKLTIHTQKDRIRIFAIFGNGKGIDISQERSFLKKLSNQAEIEFLVEPKLNNLEVEERLKAKGKGKLVRSPQRKLEI